MSSSQNELNLYQELFDEAPIGYEELDAEGNIVRANRAICKLLGYTREEILQKSAWDTLAPEDVERAKSHFAEIFASGEDPIPTTYNVYTRENRFLTVEVHCRALHDAEGKISGLRVTLIDVTQQVAAQDALKEARIWTESILHSLTSAILVTDALGFVRLINPAAEALCGWNRGEMLGISIQRALPILAIDSPAHGIPNFQMSIHTRWNGKATVLKKDRTRLHIDMTVSPVFSSVTGYTIGVATVFKEVHAKPVLATPEQVAETKAPQPTM